MRDAPSIPFNALHAVLMVARHGALAPAAQALGVTPGAVSQHVRRAEARAGVLLFERTPSGLVPTPLLKAMLADLEAGFAALGRIEARLAGPGQANALTVTAGNVFAARWLVWRLGDFSKRHPEIELRLVTTGTLLDLSRPDIDCAIRFGAGDWPGIDAIPLGGREMFPVCASALAQRLQTPADLARVPVIRDPTGMLSWEDWFSAVGAGAIAFSGPSFSDPALAFDATIAGQGVLLAMDAMADYALRNGQLVKPFDLKVLAPHGYWFATAAGYELPSRTRKFRDWLLGQMVQ